MVESLAGNLAGNWTYPLLIADMAMARGLDCFCLFDGGPAITDATWNALIPSDGRVRCRRKIEPEIYETLTAAYQNFVDQFADLVASRGRDPKKQFVQVGNEMGQGGAGDCRETALNPYGDEGTWPDFAHEWLTHLVANLDRRSIPLVSPTIEAQSTTTFGVEMQTAWASYWTQFDLLAMNMYLSTVSGYPASLREKLGAFSRRFLGIPGRFGGLVVTEFGVSSDWGSGLTDEEKSDYLAQAVRVMEADAMVAAASVYATTEPFEGYGVRPWPRS